MEIAELESKIRDRINSGREQHELLSRRADWNKLCSALDLVGDTEFALNSYLKQTDSDDAGLCYLWVYGALQVLATQQDAVGHICDALGIKAFRPPKIPHIREIRSSSVAHPAKQIENKAVKSSFIVRVSLTTRSFSLMTVYSDGRSRNRHIDIPKLVREQREHLHQVLTEVISKMDEAEAKHRAEHRNEKLESVFPEALSYYFSKIFEAIHSATYFPLGKMHVTLVTECLGGLRERLEKRGEWGVYESIDYQFELLGYPLTELDAFFDGKRSSKLNAKDAYIFCTFARDQMKVLQEIARELDDQYSSDPSHRQ